MKATSANLLPVIKGPKPFVKPIYQRSNIRQQKLLNDIFRINKDTSIPVIL